MRSSTTASACTVYPYIVDINAVEVMSFSLRVTEFNNMSSVMRRYTNLHVAFTVFKKSTKVYNEISNILVERLGLQSNNSTSKTLLKAGSIINQYILFYEMSRKSPQKHSFLLLRRHPTTELEELRLNKDNKTFHQHRMSAYKILTDVKHSTTNIIYLRT